MGVLANYRINNTRREFRAELRNDYQTVALAENVFNSGTTASSLFLSLRKSNYPLLGQRFNGLLQVVVPRSDCRIAPC